MRGRFSTFLALLCLIGCCSGLGFAIGQFYSAALCLRKDQTLYHLGTENRILLTDREEAEMFLKTCKKDLQNARREDLPKCRTDAETEESSESDD